MTHLLKLSANKLGSAGDHKIEVKSIEYMYDVLKMLVFRDDLYTRMAALNLKICQHSGDEIHKNKDKTLCLGWG